MEPAIKAFDGCELAFNQTYFSDAQRTVRVKTDAPVSSLTSREVPQSAGSFAFPKNDLELHNRFIVWRASGSNLLLEEFSAERDLQASSLCVSFSQSTIIPGTVLQLVGGSLLVVVPTQSGIHRFAVSLIEPTSGRVSVNQSTLAFFPSLDAGLARSHDFHHFSGVASKAAISVLKDGVVVAALCMEDKQLLRVTIRSPREKNEETVLEGSRLLGRLFKGGWANVWDVCTCVEEGGAVATIFSVHQDGKIRVWKSNTNSVISTINLVELLSETIKFNVVGIKVFNHSEQRKSGILLKLQSASSSRFYLFEMVAGNMKRHTSCKLETKNVVDFQCMSPSSDNDHFSLWVITRRDCTDADASAQPYILMRCSISTGMILDSHWEEVAFGLGDDATNAMLFEFSKHEAVRNKIFDGDHFSTGVVRRALQVTCKSEGAAEVNGPMKTLFEFADGYVNSSSNRYLRTLQQSHGTRGRRATGSELLGEEELDALKGRFWSDLYNSCIQLQEAETRPITFVHSATLGLIGVIQQCRFTVYFPPDDQMRSITRPHERVINRLAEIVTPVMHTECTNVLKVLDSQAIMEAVGDHVEEFSHIVETFANHSPTDLVSSLEDNCSQYLQSSFATGLLAMGLRRRVMGRLRFADLLGKLLSLVPQVNAISTEMRVNPRLDLVLNSYTGNTAQIVSCYATMWSVLSERLDVSRESRRGQISLAHAFFKYGGSKFVKKLPHIRMIISNANVQMETGEDGGESSSSFAMIPPSRWDKSTFLADPTEQVEVNETADLRSFADETILATLASIWPKSASLILPRFLLENGYFNGLEKFCILCEPATPAELSYALQYFHAVALSGLGKPEQAWPMFNEVAVGVVAKDSVLGNVLSDFQSDALPNRHPSLTEFFFKVMMVFVSHKHSSFVVKAGDKAVHCATRGDSLLPEIFTSLFTHHLTSDNPEEALRVLLVSPEEIRYSTCLRQLLTHLIDTKRAKLLVGLCYGRLTDEVADILEARCRAEPTDCQRQSIHDVTYSFYVSRCDYDKAARVMYRLAQQLRKEIHSRETLEKRCRVLAIVYQTMQVAVSHEQQFIEVEEMEDEEASNAEYGEEDAEFSLSRSRQRTNSDRGASRTVTVSKEDVGRELMKSEARLELLEVDPTVVPPLDVAGILRESLKHKIYDMAWVLIRDFDLPAYDLMEMVCTDAILTDKQSAVEPEQNIPSWVAANRQFVEDSDEKLKPHWRVVLSYMDLALQKAPSDTKLLRVVGHAFLKYSIKLPTWFEERYKRVNFGDLLLLLVEYTDLTDAFDLLLPQIDVAISRVSAGEVDYLLPMQQIEILLHYAKQESGASLPIEKTINKIQKYHSVRETIRRYDTMASANGRA